MVNDPQGARFVSGSSLLATNRTSSLVGNAIYNIKPNFFTRRRPKYDDLGNTQILDVKTLGAKGDGKSNDTTMLNSVLTRAANMSSIVYFPRGIYIIQDTLKIPRNSRIIGQAWSQIMATGQKFEDAENPRVAGKVGNEGNLGVVEIQDLLFTVSGPTAGAVLMEWNVHESTCYRWESKRAAGLPGLLRLARLGRLTGRYAAVRRECETPLSCAVEGGRIAVARVLAASRTDDFYSPKNSGLLSSAAWNGDLAMLKYLMKEVGLDPNNQSNGSYPALASAASSGQTQAAELLLEQGANPNVQIEREGLPLMIAANRGHIEIVRILLAYGTDVNPTSAHKALPIWSAMSTRKRNKVAMTNLIADHMNLNLLRTGYDNRVTLLTIAAALGRNELVQELLQEGFYPDHIWSEGVLYYSLGSQGPLEWAAEGGYDSVVKINTPVRHHWKWSKAYSMCYPKWTFTCHQTPT